MRGLAGAPTGLMCLRRARSEGGLVIARWFALLVLSAGLLAPARALDAVTFATNWLAEAEHCGRWHI